MSMKRKLTKTSKSNSQVTVEKSKDTFIIKKKKISVDFSDPEIFMHEADESMSFIAGTCEDFRIDC